MESAPFFDDVADGPADGAAHWVMASDGTRLRVGHWNASAEKGTVLLFPGRTEYIEKYGRAARDLAARGYATLAIDWRGQGLADRLMADVRLGHVGRFSDYQNDVTALVAHAERLELPRPWYLLAHSMGGSIGLRALMRGLDVRAAAFTAPMWGIYVSPMVRPVATVLACAADVVGQGHRLSPGTIAESYVLAQPFEDNKLTTDPDMYSYMRGQTLAYPAVGLGGPTMHWLHEALKDTRNLAARPAPPLPCLTFLGTKERIVDVPRITKRMADWPRGRLEMVDGAEHEVMMETPETRRRVFDGIAAFYGLHAAPAG